jgi:5'-nucleotidase
MLRRHKRAILLATLLSAGCLKEPAQQPNLAGQDVHLTVIHTADLHSRIFPYQFAPGAIDKGLGLLPSHGDIAVVGGAARVAMVVKRERKESERAIHIDSGDIFEGAPVFNLFTGEAEMRAWSRMGVAAMALGNHEFDKGAVNLELMKNQWGSFPILAANYIFTDPTDPTQPKLRDVIDPFTIINSDGLKIGIIGMGNLSSLQGIIEGGNSLGVRPIDATQALQEAVKVLRPQVDLLIVLSHLGLDEDEAAAQENSDNVSDQNEMAAIEGVDVVFGGHLHIVLNPPKDLLHPTTSNPGSHTVLCHSGAFAKYVGRLDLVVHVADPNVPNDFPNVKSYTYKLIPIDDSIPDDPDMANMLEPYQLAMNTKLNLTQNYAVIPCNVSQSTCPKVVRSDPDGGDSQLGNLVATAMRLRKRVEADFGLTNSLGIRTDFESGPLNLEEMYNVFPFDNTITTMYLSGDEIGRMMDFVANKSAMRGCKTQAQVSGLWFLMDCQAGISCGPFASDGTPATHCTADRTTGAMNQDGPLLIGDNCINNINGCTYVLPNSEYRVAVNDYIAAGGSGFTVLKNNTTKFNTGISLRDALIDYIRALPSTNTNCDPMMNTNIIYNAQDLTEPLNRPCTESTACSMNGSPPCGNQSQTDMECGPGHVCDDPNNPQWNPLVPFNMGLPTTPVCLRHYDYSGLPCLDFNIEAHDGRIGHSE